MNRQRRREIQQALIALGHPVGVVDGLFGRRTRTAISAWQESNGLSATGYLTSDQVELLLAYDEEAVREESGLELSLEELRDIERALSLAGHSPGEMDGVFDAQAREAIKRWQRANGKSPVVI